MKTEVSWKRRFLRKKFKYMLFVAAVIFVVHQLLYFKQLNRVKGKLIGDSVRHSRFIITNEIISKGNGSMNAKLIQDKTGRNVSLRGTRNMDILKYIPNSQGKFICFVSKTEIDFEKINDNYCDCPEDGSDEPGTNACNNGVFYCGILSSEMKISSYKVNDGVCDCCDGSDEWAEVKLSDSHNDSSGNISYYKSKCQSRC